QVRVRAARHRAELMRERGLQAAGDERGALLDVARARERDAPRVVRVRHDVGGAECPAELERALRPVRRLPVIAAPEADAPELLKEARRFEVRGVGLESGETAPEVGERLVRLPGVPARDAHAA